MSTEIEQRADEMFQRIDQACETSGRNPTDIKIVAVSKKFPADVVREAASAGFRVMGENRVQEAAKKIPACPDHLDWHLIGHLQTNKADQAAQLFSTIHSVDSLRLLDALEEGATKARGSLDVLIQVNIAGETQKFGVPVDEVENLITASFTRTHLTVVGLMTMPPFTTDPEQSRPVFRTLRELRDRFQNELSVGLPELSMGMSNDYTVAIEEGSTYIRLGTALFGSRAKQG